MGKKRNVAGSALASALAYLLLSSKCVCFQSPWKGSLPSPRTRMLRWPQDEPANGCIEWQHFSSLVKNGNLESATSYLQQNSTSFALTAPQLISTFDAMERYKKQHGDAEAETLFKFCADGLSNAIEDSNHFILFGAVSASNPPGAGSYIVSNNLLDEIIHLSQKQYETRRDESLLNSVKSSTTNLGTAIVVFGSVLTILKAVASLALGWNGYIFLFVATLALLATRNRLSWSTAFLDALYRGFMSLLFQPMTPEQERIIRHEAGHFFCAHVLGCLVRECSFSTGTDWKSDRILTEYIDSIAWRESGETEPMSRTTMDRRSIITMGGIAAETVHYGNSAGGRGDRLDVSEYLYQQNQDREKRLMQQQASEEPLSDSVPLWDALSISNQSRWATVQAILLLRHYKPCYDALVQALMDGKRVSECICAMEEAAKTYNLTPLDKPLGYIRDDGLSGKWEPALNDHEQQ